MHSQWESRKVKMPEVAASAPLTLDLIRPSRFGLRKTRTLWILPNSTPSDAARKKKTDKCFSHQGCAKYDKIDRTSNMTLALCVTRDTNFCPIQLHQNCFVKILCGVFLFLVISDLWGIIFHAVLIFALCEDLLFKICSRTLEFTLNLNRIQLPIGAAKLGLRSLKKVGNRACQGTKKVLK